MNPVIRELIESQLASVEYRVGLAQSNVNNLQAQLNSAEDELAYLVEERDALAEALPEPEETPTPPTQGDDE